MSKKPRAAPVQTPTENERDRAALAHERFATIGALTAGLGHDLRNAIAPALLRIDALAEAPGIGANARVELRAIRASIGTLQNIACGLHLLASDVSDDASVPRSIHLAAWWRDLAPLVVAATSPGTQLRVAISPALSRVSIPPHLLAQIVMALVMNARDQMHGNSAPGIEVSAGEIPDGVWLSLEYVGLTPDGTAPRHGMPAGLFESPIESAAGLSLEQMRTLLQAHHADLTEAEFSGVGGRFTIQLSVDDNSGAPSDKTPQPVASPSAAFSVLCIDDNELLIEALESRLSLEPGFTKLHRAEPLVDSVAIVARVKPTIVLLDYDLPEGLDALVVLKQIVRDSPDSRVILFTGFPDSQLVTDAMQLGARGFVSKGVDTDRLISAIHRVRAGAVAIELDA